MNTLHRITSLGVLSLASVLTASGGAFAADHREAPAISEDPAADLNDIYQIGRAHV